MDALEVAVRKARLRLGLARALYALCVGLLASISGACVWLVATRLFPVLGDPNGVIYGLLAFGVFAGLAWALRRYPSSKDAALELDRRLELRERVTSSLALATADGTMVAALHRDARLALAMHPLEPAFPVRPPQLARWLALPLFVLGVAYIAFPELDVLHYRARQAEALARATKQEESAKALEGAAKLLKKEDAPAKGALAESVEKLELAAGDLRSGQINEKQALAKVSDVLNDLAKQQKALAASRPAEARGLQSIDHPELKKIVEDLKNGKLQDAADKLREIEEKLKKGDLSDAEKKKLQEGLRALQNALQRDGSGQKGDNNKGQSNSDKKSGNAKAGTQGENQGESDPNAGDGGQQMEMSAEDLASSLEQMAKMQQASMKLEKWKQSELGPSKFCRSCGKALKKCDKPGHCNGECKDGECQGVCSSCNGKGLWKAGTVKGQGGGMGKWGQGGGGEVGHLPDDANVDFQPTTLPGAQTKGKILTEITERTAPVVDGETSQVEVMHGGFEAVQQQAEEALNHEEIPAGAKEYVRQYFGASETAAETH